MDIQGIGSPGFGRPQSNTVNQQQAQNQQEIDAAQQAQIRAENDTYKQRLQEAVARLDKFSESFDRKFRYSFNQQLNEVVVKIIDPKTDEVIRELPPADIQKLQMRIEEYLGKIIDKTA
jgi:flagellar protein FlaG